MQCYLLLRNNMESGPFTFDEVTAQALKPTDLIWIEGQSVAWQYPTEIEILQPFVTVSAFEAASEPICNDTNTSRGIFVAHPQPYRQNQNFKDHSQEPMLETRFSQPLETLQETYNTSRKNTSFSFPKTFSKPHSALWLFCVFAGLLLSAFLIKKIVEAYEGNETEIATALPVNDMSEPERSREESLYQNALTTEVVPIDTVTMKPVKKAPAKANLKRLVRLEANDYQVGLFGGIKNLRLLLTNKSGFVLDKVKIELQYLKPNGTVLKTENLTMKSVQPKSSKSLAIASKNRGVKVAYRVTDIQSKQNAEAMVNL